MEPVAERGVVFADAYEFPPICTKRNRPHDVRERRLTTQMIFSNLLFAFAFPQPF
jgi:hypothetical protein